MSSILKTSKREHLRKTLVIIILMHEEGELHVQIGDHLKLAKSIVISIIYCYNRQPKHPFQLITRAGRPPKLDKRAARLLIRHVEQNFHNNLKALDTPSKSGQILSRVTVRKYLKANRYFRFKA